MLWLFVKLTQSKTCSIGVQKAGLSNTKLTAVHMHGIKNMFYTNTCRLKKNSGIWDTSNLAIFIKTRRVLYSTYTSPILIN